MYNHKTLKHVICNSIHAILFLHFREKIVKRCSFVHRTPPNLGQITRQRIRMNVIGVFDYFQTCTFPRSLDHLCVSASIRIDEIMLMVDSSVHVRLPVRNPTRYVSVSTPLICPDFSTRKNVSQDNGSQSAFVSLRT